MTRNPPGYVIWEGASLIDGAPIVCIATGVGRKSKNGKTGAMVQTNILRRDVSPVDAVRSGEDASICGDCAHRSPDGFKGRTCYVVVGQGPRVVWEAMQRGVYPQATPEEVSEIVEGRGVRIGTYGDPAAVPAHVWATLVRRALFRTGYSHQWRTAAGRSLRGLVMASVDSPKEALEAQYQGWRTFRVTRDADEPSVGQEVVCPASAEAGRKLKCAECKACDGDTSRRASIRIAAHGSMSNAANLQALDARLIARG